MGFTIRDTVKKTFGYILAVPGVLMFFMGIAMFFVSGNAGEKEAGAGIAIFSLSLVLSGFFFLYRGYRDSREEELVESLAMAVHANRRITMDDAATKLGITIPRARSLMMTALKKKLVKGYFDRTTGEFFTEEGKGDKQQFRFCPYCGAPFKKIYLEGETIRCESCSSLISGS